MGRRCDMIITGLAVCAASAGAHGQSIADFPIGSGLEGQGPQRVPGRDNRVQREREPEPVIEETAAESASFFEWDRLTGDWGGARSSLEERGISVEGSVIADWFAVIDGGVRRDASFLTFVDVNATFDLEALAGVPGMTVFADAYWIDGNSVSESAGDFQGVSNIEADNRLQVSELWVEQRYADGTVRWKLGKIEANSEFAFVESAGGFVNSSAGFSPTIVAMPTFPDPSVGLVVSVTPSEIFSVTGAVMDGSATVDGVSTGDQGPASFFSDDRSDDYVAFLEGNVFWEGGRGGVGVWYHTGDFPEFSGGMQDGVLGLYALGEHRIVQTSEEGGIDLFGQIGWTDDEVSDAEFHFGIGSAWSGPFADRPADSTGVYVSTVILSDAAGYSRDEAVIEVYYSVQVAPWAAIKPDIQYIVNPSGDPAVSNALVAGVRAELAL